MPNITISLEKDLLESGRNYAKKHSTSLNALIRNLLKQTVMPQSKNWIEQSFKLMDQTEADSKGKIWYREDLYDI